MLGGVLREVSRCHLSRDRSEGEEPPTLGFEDSVGGRYRKLRGPESGRVGNEVKEADGDQMVRNLTFPPTPISFDKKSSQFKPCVLEFEYREIPLLAHI